MDVWLQKGKWVNRKNEKEGKTPECNLDIEPLEPADHSDKCN